MHNPVSTSSLSSWTSEQESSDSNKKQHFTKDYSGFTQPMMTFSESSYFSNFLNINIDKLLLLIFIKCDDTIAQFF